MRIYTQSDSSLSLKTTINLAVNAVQIQLLSTMCFVLYDPVKQIIDQYDQYDDFQKQRTINLPKQLEDGLKLYVDDTQRYWFYNSKCLFYATIDK
jgi:hypothetical protein